MSTHEEVEKVAYDLYLKSGCAEGRSEENWFEAERIVRERLSGKGAERKSLPKRPPASKAGKAGGRKPKATV